MLTKRFEGTPSLSVIRKQLKNARVTQRSSKTKIATFTAHTMKPKSTLRLSGRRVRCLKIILASKVRLSVASLKPERITETSMSCVVWPEEAKCRPTGRSESGSLVERRCSLNLSPVSTSFTDIDLVTCAAFYSINHVLAGTGTFRFKMDASTWSIENCAGVGMEAGVEARSATGNVPRSSSAEVGLVRVLLTR